MMFFLRYIFFMTLSFSLYAEGNTIVLVAENNTPALNGLYKKLKVLAPELTLRISTESSPLEINKDDFLVLVGDDAPTYTDLQKNNKTIAVLVTKAQATLLNTQTSIWVEPPLNRQLELANLVIPGNAKIGFLVNGERDKQAQISSLSKRQLKMLDIVDLKDSQNINQALYNVLKESKLILASYNNTIYNARSIKNILITSYRQQKVLIGPSRAFLKAGSFATTFSNMNHIAMRIIETVRYHQSSGLWLEADYNPHYSILFNTQVARSLGVPIMDTDVLKQQLDNTVSK